MAPRLRRQCELMAKPQEVAEIRFAVAIDVGNRAERLGAFAQQRPRQRVDVASIDHAIAGDVARGGGRVRRRAASLRDEGRGR